MNKLVFDVGGTFIKWAVMDKDANILEKGSYPTPMESREAFLDSLASLFAEKMNEVDGIAMSMPGNIDSQTGFVYTPGALRFNYRTPVARDLEAAVKEKTGKEIHVAIENDGKSAALAEVWKGNLENNQSGAVIILGTGIGGGIILDRKVLKGNDFFAGELSFLMSDVSKTGFANALANQASAISLCNKVASYKGLDNGEIDGFKVFELLEQGDPEATQAFEEVCTALAGTIYNLECILNPEKVLIGGGISKQPLLVETIRKKADEMFDAIGKYGMSMPRPEIDVCRHFNDSNMIGALYNYDLLYGLE